MCQAFGDTKLDLSKTFGVTGTPDSSDPIYFGEHLEREIQNRDKTLRADSELVRLNTGGTPAEFTLRGKKHCQTLSNQTRHWDWQRTSWRKKFTEK